MLGDTCFSASLAELTIEVLTADGARLIGVPIPERHHDAIWAADDLGSAEVSIDEKTIALESIITYVVYAPTLNG